MRILVVEDEPAISHLIQVYLEREGYQVQVETDGEHGLVAARESGFDAIVLDVGLPSLDGTEICKMLRAEDNWTPIIFCSARDEEVDRILGLELGADDYLTKPFSPRELVARVKAIGRRAIVRTAHSKELSVGSVILDTITRQAVVAGTPVGLTATEFDLLSYLFLSPERVVTREELLENVWGYQQTLGTRTVDVHVAQLRSKLGEHSPIHTSRGVGYSVKTPMP